MDDIQNEPQGLDIQDDSASAPENETPNTEATDDQGGDDVSQEQKVIFDEAQQAKVNGLIGEKVAKVHEEKRLRQAAEQRLALYESQQPKPEEPTIPELPDPDDFYGDDAGYQAKMLERDTAIIERAEFNAQQTHAEGQQQALAQQQGLEAAQKQQEQQESYVGTAETFGIKPDQVQKDAVLVSQYLSNDIQDYIVQDPQGPLISNFLSKDLVELDKVRSMPPLKAAVYIANEIKPKLSGIKKITKTPAPNSIVDGSSVSEKADPRLNGVTYS